MAKTEPLYFSYVRSSVHRSTRTSSPPGWPSAGRVLTSTRHQQNLTSVADDLNDKWCKDDCLPPLARRPTMASLVQAANRLYRTPSLCASQENTSFLLFRISKHDLHRKKITKIVQKAIQIRRASRAVANTSLSPERTCRFYFVRP
ncbi:hypothetical protein EVAR_30475_1 [Eumeta japonica]|uniref:Uncharacterized protein n=1 Tax=Eumeta variegata TaxID=151549 RepID=A0A4C1VWX0_EUMVA|nr:hypothetical protein EVAR_30475_1 [Eumeta japonica]